MVNKRQAMFGFLMVVLLCLAIQVKGQEAAPIAGHFHDPYDHRPLEEITPAERAKVRGFSPYVGRQFPTQVLFGDTPSSHSQLRRCLHGGATCPSQKLIRAE